ncbi:IS5 family transposase ISMac15 [Planctomycetes bacterium FF15]|uniref:IS5 family transposase ISMac15 n=1 Tax=Bremerella alba TaxID=980252 RepID=A0A7V9A8U3_9BACT|nr:IS5 family transposase ISMac15 [Bremerella alba]
MQDRDGGQSLIDQTKIVLSRLRTIFADGVYNGSFELFCRNVGWNLKIVRRSDKPGFHVLPKRWIVERTFAWLTRHRRLTADYETTTSSSEAFLQLAMIRLMVRRLAK